MNLPVKHLRLALASLALSIGLAGAAQAQVVAGLDGRWEGNIETPDGALPVVMRVSTAAGKTTVMLDSPTQGATDIPATPTRDGDKVKLDVSTTEVVGTYAGTLAADGKTIAGAWTQNGMTMTLNVTKK